VSDGSLPGFPAASGSVGRGPPNTLAVSGETALAAALYRSGKLEEAAKHLEQVCKKDASDPMAHLLWAMTSRKLKQKQALDRYYRCSSSFERLESGVNFWEPWIIRLYHQLIFAEAKKLIGPQPGWGGDSIIGPPKKDEDK